MEFGIFVDWIANKPNYELYVIGILMAWCFTFLYGSTKQTILRNFIFWIIRIVTIVLWIEVFAFFIVYTIENIDLLDDFLIAIVGFAWLFYCFGVSVSYTTLLERKGLAFTLANWKAPWEYRSDFFYEILGRNEYVDSNRAKNWYKLVLDEEEYIQWHEIYNEEE